MNPTAIKVSMIEDNAEAVKFFKQILMSSQEFKFLDWFPSVAIAEKQLPFRKPDVLVLDIGMPEQTGIDALAKFSKVLTGTKFVMYTVFEDEENLLASIRLGANGYILKDTPPELLLAELKVIALGGSTLTPKVARHILKEEEGAGSLAPTSSSGVLGKRETEVLNLISLGFAYGDIAKQLGISYHTVRRHVEKIYSKLQVHTQGEAVRKGTGLGILGENSENRA